MVFLSPKGKWSALVVTALSVILPLTTWFSATAIIPDISKDIHFTTNQLAWLTNGVQAGFVLGAIVTSLLSLADVLLPQILMAWSAVLAGFANAFILLDIGPEGIIIARILTGIALSGIYPPSMKFIATWFLKGRGLAMGTLVGALTFGSALPHYIRAIEFGLDWQVVIIVSSVACLVSAVIFAFILKEGPERFARTKISPRHLGRILRNKPVMLANFGYFGHMWELYAMWGWFLSYSISAKTSMAADWNASILTFSVIALGAPSSVIAGLIADKIGRPITTVACMVISGSCAILIGVFFDGPSWLFIIIAAIWGFTVVADSAQFSASVSEYANNSLIGTALVFQMGVGFAITIFIIWLVPHLAELFGGWRWTFVILAIGPILGTGAMIRLHRNYS